MSPTLDKETSPATELTATIANMSRIAAEVGRALSNRGKWREVDGGILATVIGGIPKFLEVPGILVVHRAVIDGKMI